MMSDQIDVRLGPGLAAAVRLMNGLLAGPALEGRSLSEVAILCQITVAPDDDPAGRMEIAAATGLNEATVSRITYVLISSGLIVRDSTKPGRWRATEDGKRIAGIVTALLDWPS